jgi:hypothetical protein
MASAADRRALERIRRRMAEDAPGLAASILRAISQLQNTPIAAIERALVGGGVEAVISELFSEAQVNAAMADARREIIRIVDRQGRSTWANVIPGAVSGTFDVLAPQVLERVQTMATRALGQFSRDVADTVRREAERGLVDGENPRTTARRIREVVGLAPSQAESVASFRDVLEGGPRATVYADWKSRELRDKRFDRTIQKAIASKENLAPEQVDRMVDAYQRKFVAFHAETIARTTALDANKLGQELAFEQAVDAGLVDTARLVKRWVTTLDGRERPEHAEMDGVEVPYDEPWDVPGAGPQMYPGDGEWNCRCAAVYRLLPRGEAA